MQTTRNIKLRFYPQTSCELTEKVFVTIGCRCCVPPCMYALRARATFDRLIYNYRVPVIVVVVIVVDIFAVWMRPSYNSPSHRWTPDITYTHIVLIRVLNDLSQICAQLVPHRGQANRSLCDTFFSSLRRCALVDVWTQAYSISELMWKLTSGQTTTIRQ